MAVPWNCYNIIDWQTSLTDKHQLTSPTYNIINWQTLFTWLWRWLPLSLSKRQSLTTVLFFSKLHSPGQSHHTITTDTHGFKPFTIIRAPFISSSFHHTPQLTVVVQFGIIKYKVMVWLSQHLSSTQYLSVINKKHVTPYVCKLTISSTDSHNTLSCPLNNWALISSVE